MDARLSASIGRGRAGMVRGKTRRRNPRLPPPVEDSHRQRPPAPERITSPDIAVDAQTEFERLAALPSKFGGTDLERVADGAAAELGFEFDEAQKYIPIAMNGSYTLVDRFLAPNTLVYLDGVQHFLRLDAEQQDMIQKIALESMGYKVVRITWQELQRDPMGAVLKVLYAY